MTIVFFLFLTHLGLGLLAMLPFVPDRAGRSYFKFCSASAAFTMSAGLGLLLRRYGLAGGTDAPAGGAYRALLVAGAVGFVGAVVYNRAWHFSWRAIRPLLLAVSLAAGIATGHDAAVRKVWALGGALTFGVLAATSLAPLFRTSPAGTALPFWG